MYTFPGRHDPAFEPGKTLPLAALRLKVVFKCIERQGGWPRISVRPQSQVQPEHKAVLGGIANQAVQCLDLVRKILVVGNAATPVGQACCFAIMVIDINQVNVTGDIELAPAQFAHADDPQLCAAAVVTAWASALRHTIGGIQRLLGCLHGYVQCQLSQLGHGAGHHGQRCPAALPAVTVHYHQTLHDQLAQHPQGGTGVQTVVLQGFESGLHVCPYGRAFS